MLAHSLLANPPLQEDKDNLVAGYPRMVAVDFPKDPERANDKVYGKLKEDYHAAYSGHMPKVPAVLTHCTIDEVFDDPDRKMYPHTARVKYHSMVLVPRRWTIHTDVSEATVGGRGEVVTVEQHEEEAELGVTVDFNAKASVEVKKGPASASLDGGVGFGAKWRRKVSVRTTHTQTLEAGCVYQPTRVFAKLVCDVVQAKTGEFTATSSSGKPPFTCELVSTRPAHAAMEDRFRTSTSTFGYKKSLREIDALYRACGTDLTTLMSPKNEALFTFMRVSSAKLKLVVDLEEARLWVSSTAACLEWHGAYNPDDLKRGVINQEEEHICAKMDDYRGLWGKEAAKNVETEVTFASSGKQIKALKTFLKIVGK